MEASRVQFACANPEKSEMTQKKLQSIMATEESKLDYDRHKSHPVPSGMLVSIPLEGKEERILVIVTHYHSIVTLF